jgi:hypothetical protein
VEENTSVVPPCSLLDHSNLSGLAVPGDEIAHVDIALGRIHRHGGTDISLTGRVGDLVGLIVHADMVGRHVEQLGVRAISRRLFGSEIGNLPKREVRLRESETQRTF